MPDKYTDPGSANFFDAPRDIKTVRQGPVSREVPFAQKATEDNLAKTQKQMSKKYLPASERQKQAFMSGFSTGFSDKLAGMPEEDQYNLLARLFLVGENIKQAAATPGQASPVPSTMKMSPPNLGSQVNMMGRTMPPDPSGKKMSGNTPAAQAFSGPRNSLKDMLPQATVKNNIMSLDWNAKR